MVVPHSVSTFLASNAPSATSPMAKPTSKAMFVPNENMPGRSKAKYLQRVRAPGDRIGLGDDLQPFRHAVDGEQRAGGEQEREVDQVDDAEQDLLAADAQGHDGEGGGEAQRQEQQHQEHPQQVQGVEALRERQPVQSGDVSEAQGQDQHYGCGDQGP